MIQIEYKLIQNVWKHLILWVSFRIDTNWYKMYENFNPLNFFFSSRNDINCMKIDTKCIKIFNLLNYFSIKIDTNCIKIDTKMYENFWTCEFLFSIKIDNVWKFMNLWISFFLLKNDTNCIKIDTKCMKIFNPLNIFFLLEMIQIV